MPEPRSELHCEGCEEAKPASAFPPSRQRDSGVACHECEEHADRIEQGIKAAKTPTYRCESCECHRRTRYFPVTDGIRSRRCEGCMSQDDQDEDDESVRQDSPDSDDFGPVPAALEGMFSRDGARLYALFAMSDTGHCVRIFQSLGAEEREIESEGPFLSRQSAEGWAARYIEAERRGVHDVPRLLDEAREHDRRAKAIRRRVARMIGRQKIPAGSGDQMLLI